jgi:hypothetical protein
MIHSPACRNAVSAWKMALAVPLRKVHAGDFVIINRPGDFKNAWSCQGGIEP